MGFSSRPKFISFAIILVLLMISKFLVVQKPEKPISYEYLFEKHPISKFLLSNQYILIAFHITGIFIGFCSTYILGCSLLPSFLLLCARFLLFAPYVDFIFSFTSIGFFIISISTQLTSKYRKWTPFFIILSGIYSALCVNILIEMITIGLFSFFSILFLWLKSHRIGNDDGSAASDAIATVGTFMISFGVGFYLFGYLFGFPKYSPFAVSNNGTKSYWKLTDTLSVFPILYSRLALSSLLAFISNLETNKKLLCLTAVLCAEFFRVLPFSSENAAFDLVTQVSASFLDLSGLVFTTGVSTRFIGLFSTAIYLSLSLIMQFAFHLF